MQLDQYAHASEELLEMYAMGSLPEPALADLEEHLLVCSRCQERLQEAEAYLAAMRGAAAGLQHGDESRTPFWTRVYSVLALPTARWAVVAAVALVLAGLSLRLYLGTLPTREPVALVLDTRRGSELPRAPADRPLAISLDITGLPTIPSDAVEVVDGTGHVVATPRADTTQGRVRISVAPGLRRGNYFIRLYSPARELLREYGLRIE